MQSLSKGAQQKVEADRQDTEGFFRESGPRMAPHRSSIWASQGSNVLHCGYRLCCLGVPRVTCKKPAPHLPDRFARAAPESVGRQRQVTDTERNGTTSATRRLGSHHQKRGGSGS